MIYQMVSFTGTLSDL